MVLVLVLPPVASVLSMLLLLLVTALALRVRVVSTKLVELSGMLLLLPLLLLALVLVAVPRWELLMGRARASMVRLAASLESLSVLPALKVWRAMLSMLAVSSELLWLLLLVTVSLLLRCGEVSALRSGQLVEGAQAAVTNGSAGERGGVDGAGAVAVAAAVGVGGSAGRAVVAAAAAAAGVAH